MTVDGDRFHLIEVLLDCEKRLHVVPEGFEVVDEGGFRIRLRAPTASPSELLGMLWEISLDENGEPCRIKEVKAPINRRTGFRGKTVLRRILGRGPMLAASIAKGRILDPRNHAKLFSEMARQGLDIGMDPLHYSDLELYERAYHIEEEIDSFKEEGKRVLYVYNAPKTADLLEKVISLGAKAFRVDSLNLELFNLLADVKVMIFLTRPYLLPRLSLESIYNLLPPFGFEAIERPSSSKWTKAEHLDRLIKRTGSLPMTSPDVTPRNLDYNMSDLDVIIWADVFIYAHPSGPLAGVRAAREMIDSYLRGESLITVARRVEEVGQAVEKWGLELR